MQSVSYSFEQHTAPGISNIVSSAYSPPMPNRTCTCFTHHTTRDLMYRRLCVFSSPPVQSRTCSCFADPSERNSRRPERRQPSELAHTRQKNKANHLVLGYSTAFADCLRIFALTSHSLARRHHLPTQKALHRPTPAATCEEDAIRPNLLLTFQYIVQHS